MTVYSVGLTREWLDNCGGPRPDVVLDGTRCNFLPHGVDEMKGKVLYTYEEHTNEDGSYGEEARQFTPLLEGDTVVVTGSVPYNEVHCLQSHKINVVIMVEQFDEHGTLDYKMVRGLLTGIRIPGS